MKITMVTHYFGSHQGGIELVADRLARELCSRYDVQLTWAASDCDGPPENMPENMRPVPMRSWNGIERGTGLPFPIWTVSSMRRLSQLIGEADIVLTHDCLYLGNRMAGILARRHDKPLVVVSHVGLVPYRARTLRAFMHLANRVSAVPMLRSAARVVVVSQTTKRYFETISSYHREFVFIPNGVDTNVFHPLETANSKAIRSRWGVNDGKPVIVFVGRFVEKKGLHVLRHLVKAIPEAWWLFVGWGPISPASWHVSNVRLIGRLEQYELASIYQAADLLVLPSVGEGFPLVLQEAMACGLATLTGTDACTADPGCKELILGEQVDLRAMDETVRRWTIRVRELLSDSDRLLEVGRKAAAYAQANWSWPCVAGAYARLFNDVYSAQEDLA